MKEYRQVTAVLRKIKKYLPAGSKIVVACSGGADSLALVDALLYLREARKYKVVVCHVEHGIRGAEALADADFVEDFCKSRSVSCEIRHVAAKTLAETQKISLEDAARKLRYGELQACVALHQADFLVTAHHRGDQAETLLLHLLRGSGLDGLGGMRTKKNFLLRPFLELSRQSLENYCALRGLEYRSDSSNNDLEFSRNKVRHLLLPLIERSFNPGIESVLAQTAELLAADADYLNSLAKQRFAENVTMLDAGCSCSLNWLRELPQVLAARVVRLMWTSLAVKGMLTYQHTRQILALVCRGNGNKTIALPGRSYAVYGRGKLFMVLGNRPSDEFAGRAKCPTLDYIVRGDEN